MHKIRTRVRISKCVKVNMSKKRRQQTRTVKRTKEGGLEQCVSGLHRRPTMHTQKILTSRRPGYCSSSDSTPGYDIDLGTV